MERRFRNCRSRVGPEIGRPISTKVNGWAPPKTPHSVYRFLRKEKQLETANEQNNCYWGHCGFDFAVYEDVVDTSVVAMGKS